MEFREINRKDVWENFLLKCKEKTFLQSWNWGEFNKLMGNKIWRLGVFDDGKLIFLLLAVKIQAKRGTFLQIQHWPIPLKETNSQRFSTLFRILLNRLIEIAQKEGCSFIRLVPLLERNEKNEIFFRDLGFREAPIHANAYEASWKTEITFSEEELLKNMRKTTRYLIKQAQKNPDIEIFQSQRSEDVDFFYQMHQAVAKARKFTPFSLEYLKNEFLAFLPDNQVSLFFGKYKGEIIAGAFIIFWSQIGFYHHAALLPQYHKIPITYLLLWETIREAKRKGCWLYDFWGYINPKEKPQHPWSGPTFFKMGFGGRAYQYLKTQDLVLSKKYWLTYFFEKIRKIKRRL